MKTNEWLHNFLVGAGDGITVPFAIACGMVGAGFSNETIFIAGLIVLICGALTMGFGAYMTERTELQDEQNRYHEDHKHSPVAESEKVNLRTFFNSLGIKGNLLEQASEDLAKEKQDWLQYRLTAGHHQTTPDEGRPYRSAITIFLSYVVGGFIPILPFTLIASIPAAIRLAVIFSIIVIFAVGYFKCQFRGMNPWAGAIRETIITSAAGGGMYMVGQLF